MTKVIYREYGDYRYLAAKGHATGDDEKICAGISAIMYALAGFLTNEHGIHVNAIQLESGDAVIEAGDTERLKAAFDMALIGLMQLARKWPEYVEIDIQ